MFSVIIEVKHIGYDTDGEGQYRQYIQLFSRFDAGELWNLSSTQQCPPCGHPYQFSLFNPHLDNCVKAATSHDSASTKHKSEGFFFFFFKDLE